MRTIHYNVGENHGISKLTASDVLTIRMLTARGDLKYKEIAPIFNVSSCLIGCIHRRTIWKHIP